MIPAVFCWSGGKDSALCLYKVREEKKYDVRFLLTTVSEEFRRISMHGVREELLEEQARQAGIPLIKIYVREGTNSEYEARMEEMLLSLKRQGIHHVIFGDIFLQDLREYREKNLAKVEMQGIFPLWKKDTKKLAEEFLSLGFKTYTCCTNDAYLGKEWVGRRLDENFLSELPPNVDPCGENGEYHTFCFQGPIFRFPIDVSIGEKIYRHLEIKQASDCNLPQSQTKGFWYCDLFINYGNNPL